MEDGGALCLDAALMPTRYDKGTLLATAQGICGFRLQIENISPYEFNIKVLRDAATSLAVGAAGIALIALV